MYSDCHLFYTFLSYLMVQSFRGYHYYQNIWVPYIHCLFKENNPFAGFYKPANCMASPFAWLLQPFPPKIQFLYCLPSSVSP